MPVDAQAAAPVVAPAAAAAPAAAPADTALTSDASAQTPEAGQGGASTEAGQGADNGNATTGGASAEGGETTGGAGEDALGAPEQYAAFTVPDGVELSGDMLDSVTSFAKAQKLNQTQAQALVDLGAKQAQTIAKQFLDDAAKSPVLLANHWAGEWSKQTASDADIGGQNLAGTMALTRRVFATFGTPALGEFLTQTGLAHHPELVRFMNAVGKAVSEDTLVTPAGGGKRADPPGQNTAKKLYPSMA